MLQFSFKDLKKWSWNVFGYTIVYFKNNTYKFDNSIHGVCGKYGVCKINEKSNTDFRKQKQIDS